METVVKHPSSALSFKELADGFMAAYRGKDPMVNVRLKFWTERFSAKAPADIDSDDIEDALDYLEHNPVSKRITTLSPKSVNLSLGVLSTVLAYGRRRRLLPRGWQNPCAEVPKRKGEGSRTRFLTKLEYEKLIDVSRLCRWRMLTLLILLAVSTGARKGSLLSLRWGDIDFERCEGYLETTKNGEPFTLILYPHVMAELATFKRGQDNELIFESTRVAGQAMNFTKHYKRALEDAGIKDACFHSLRHTHASWLARDGKSLLEIANSLNHKTLQMVRRYAHLTTDSRRESNAKTFC